MNRLEFGKLAKGMYRLLKKKADEYKVIEDTILQHSSDPEKLQQYMHSIRLKMLDLECDNSRYKTFMALLSQIEENKRLLVEAEGDREMIKMLEDDNKKLLHEYQALEKELASDLLPTQKYDKKNCSVELRQAVGGKESALFAEWLMEVYTNFAGRMGWNWETEKLVADSSGRGIKNSTFRVTGFNAYKYFKYESGVHKYV